MNKKSTVPILFHGGSYGTYLEWCLTALTTDLLLASPFNHNGNSHKFKGNHLLNVDGWRRYVSSIEQHNFVRLHPKTKQAHCLQEHLDEISKQVDFFIYVYPTRNTFLLCLNNQISKVWKDWWEYSFQLGGIDPEKIYKNWPIDKTTTIDQIPDWIKREFLSYYLIPSWADQIEWTFSDHCNQSNCVFVSVEDLLYDFKNSVSIIIDRLNLSTTKSISEFLPYHDIMIGLQKNINQDTLSKKIIDSVVNQELLDWSNQYLTLTSESYIQWQLRNLGYELRCHGLDTFPTNSVQLKELLYIV